MSTQPNASGQAGKKKTTAERIELAQAITNLILAVCAIIGIAFALWQLCAVERQICDSLREVAEWLNLRWHAERVERLSILATGTLADNPFFARTVPALDDEP